MGGVLRMAPNMLHLPAADYNVLCDVEAAKIVFESGIPLVMVPANVTWQVWLDGSDLVRFQASDEPLLKALGSLMVRWFDHIKRERSYMHDPLALSYLVHPEFLELHRVKLSVQLCGDQRGQTLWQVDEPSSCQVAIGVRASDFVTFLRSRLFGSACEPA